MESYESKQAAVKCPAERIYIALSNFSNFTPILKDKVDNWQADENTCQFTFKGITVNLRIVDKEPYKVIKFSGDKNMPLDFTLWLQMKELAYDDTRIRIVVHTELNMFMKMMIGGKIQKAIDEMVEKIAYTFNSITI